MRSSWIIAVPSPAGHRLCVSCATPGAAAICRPEVPDARCCPSVLVRFPSRARRRRGRDRPGQARRPMEHRRDDREGRVPVLHDGAARDQDVAGLRHRARDEPADARDVFAEVEAREGHELSGDARRRLGEGGAAGQGRERDRRRGRSHRPRRLRRRARAGAGARGARRRLHPAPAARPGRRRARPAQGLPRVRGAGPEQPVRLGG